MPKLAFIPLAFTLSCVLAQAQEPQVQWVLVDTSQGTVHEGPPAFRDQFDSRMVGEWLQKRLRKTLAHAGPAQHFADQTFHVSEFTPETLQGLLAARNAVGVITYEVRVDMTPAYHQGYQCSGTLAFHTYGVGARIQLENTQEFEFSYNQKNAHFTAAQDSDEKDAGKHILRAVRGLVDDLKLEPRTTVPAFAGDVRELAFTAFLTDPELMGALAAVLNTSPDRAWVDQWYQRLIQAQGMTQAAALKDHRDDLVWEEAQQASSGVQDLFHFTEADPDNRHKAEAIAQAFRHCVVVDSLADFKWMQEHCSVPSELEEEVYRWQYSKQPAYWREERLTALKSLANRDPDDLEKVRQEEVPLAEEVLAGMHSSAGFCRLFEMSRDPKALRQAQALAKSRDEQLFLEQRIIRLVGPGSVFVAFGAVEGDTHDLEQTLHGIITRDAGKTHTTNKQFTVRLRLTQKQGAPLRVAFEHHLRCRVTLHVRTRYTLGSQSGKVETNTIVRDVDAVYYPALSTSTSVDFGQVAIAGAYTGDQGLLGGFFSLITGNRGEKEWRYDGSSMECDVLQVD